MLGSEASSMVSCRLRGANQNSYCASYVRLVLHTIHVCIHVRVCTWARESVQYTMTQAYTGLDMHHRIGPHPLFCLQPLEKSLGLALLGDGGLHQCIDMLINHLACEHIATSLLVFYLHDMLTASFTLLMSASSLHLANVKHVSGPRIKHQTPCP